MSSPRYDDSPAGLMHVIRELVRAPGEDVNNVKPKKSEHPYYKRPGKGHNHDCCDACQEGGDLICCDRCPSSFHLGCHDPPLERSDIPHGQWLCLECKSSGERLRPVSPSSSHKSSEGEKKTRNLRVNRSNSSVSSTSTSSRKNEKEKDFIEKEMEAAEKNIIELPEPIIVDKEVEEKDLSPMEILVRAAKVMNPRQFELPREMQIHCPFPGTDKTETNGNRMGLVRDVYDCVPLPAKVCYHCQVSCRTAPLVQCDYCPLLYHQDCLDPPLTAFPAGRWMCPNHVEQYIDWKLVNSVSITERVALWDKFGGPVDQDAVRLDFIRCARKKFPPFRIRLPSGPPRGRVRVPGMVRHHYRHPPPLLPQRREMQRCNMVLKNQNMFNTSLDDEENIKKEIICLNLNCHKYLSINETCTHEIDSESFEQNMIADEDLKIISGEDHHSADEGESKHNIADDASDTQETKLYLTIGPKKRKMQKDHQHESAHDSDKTLPKDVEPSAAKVDDDKLDVILGIVGIDSKETNEILYSVEQQLKKLDSRLVKLLAFQRLQQLLGLDNGDVLDDSVSELITKSIDKSSLCRYGFRHVALPSELLSQSDMERIAKEVAGAVAPKEEVLRLRMIPVNCTGPSGVPTVPTPTAPMPSLSALPVRATLCPVERPARNGLGDGFGRPVPMRLSRLSIGRGACDLPLQRYGTCSYVSDKHALIFYDEITRHFELINYSEFGTCVNGQLYSCDFSEVQPSIDDISGTEEKAAGLRAIAHKRQRRNPLNLSQNISDVSPGPPCACTKEGIARRELIAGWEGTALLSHGALIQFGCIMFVFSITDAPTIKEEDDLKME
ncbi:PHD finger protein 12 isoform X2 [Arctopsyche grandis]|uniref:PHD finger protein 12 isoform X2 n=1 Tax=Arctopsyche grandis TaxID=121162 RepID=UPI00406D6A7E